MILQLLKNKWGGAKPLPYSFLQMLLCVAMVISVSPSCVKNTPKRLISYTVLLQAIPFANAVIAAVNSQEFMDDHPKYPMPWVVIWSFSFPVVQFHDG